MHRTEIDGLRAVAVISVIITHFNKTLLPSGHLGVDIFYVISGFVITQSLVTRQHDSFRGYIFDFYNRRVKRLAPALFLCVTVTCVFVLLIIAPQSRLSTSSLHTGIAALFGLSNLYLLRQATDYFGSSAELNPFTHTWSLGVEEQFYLLFPFLIWFSGLGRKTKTSARKFLWIIGTTALVSLISYFWFIAWDPLKTFYLMPMRFWELAFGSIAYFFLDRSEKRPDAYENQVIPSISTPAFILILIVLFLPQAQPDIGFSTVAVVTLTAVLMFTLRPASLVYKLLTFRPLIFLGVISYSLYLWHWSVLTISRWTIGLHFWALPFQFAVIILLATLSHTFVEKPLRHSDWTLLKFGKILQIGAIGHAAIAVIGLSGVILLLAIPLHRQGYLYTGITAPLIKRGTDTLMDRQSFEEYSWSGSQCVLASNNEAGKIITPDQCTFGDFYTATRRFLVIGNSFSAAEIEMFKVLVEQKRGAVTITSCWGASAVPEIKNDGVTSKANDYYWGKVIPSLLGKLRSGDIVLMINEGASFSPKNVNDASTQLSGLRKGLSRISEELLKRGIFVIYQNGNPFMRESNCTPDTAMPQWWHFINEPACTYYTRTESLARRRAYDSLLLDLQRKYSNFFVLDLFDVYCPGDVCKYYNKEGIFLYRDEASHPSVEANILAQPFLLEIVDNAIRRASQPGLRTGDSATLNANVHEEQVQP